MLGALLAFCLAAFSSLPGRFLAARFPTAGLLGGRLPRCGLPRAGFGCARLLCDRFFCARLACGFSAALLFRRNFSACFARFRQTDGDGLLTALDRLAGASALQCSTLTFVHRLLDFARSLF